VIARVEVKVKRLMTQSSSTLLLLLLLLLLLCSEDAHGSAATEAPTPLAMKTVGPVPASGLDVTGVCQTKCEFESPAGCANSRAPQG
jgi:hypothetical protein